MPGANTSVVKLTLPETEGRSPSFDELTETTPERHAGSAIALVSPLFPEDATVRIPLSRRVDTAEAVAEVSASTVSQSPGYVAKVPRLRLMTSTPRGLEINSSSAARISLKKKNWPESLATLTGRIDAPGLTPTGATPPSPAATPATWVPCPKPSSAAPMPLCRSDPLGQKPLPSIVPSLSPKQRASSRSTRPAKSG